MAEHRVETLLKDGEMKRLELEGKPVVVARVQGQYYAFGGNCSHYGAPLNEGVLKGHQLICPWHHACFDIRNGARLEPPALNDLMHFPVRIDGDDVYVTLPHDNVRDPQGKVEPGETRTFVIVGGGAAGNSAAEELRRSDFRGKIIIVSAAPNVPLDRPNLSKDYLAGEAEPDWIPLRGEKWYVDRDIELRLNMRVTKVDPQSHTLTLENGQNLTYDKLLLATGALPRQLRNVPGTELEGVFLLREMADADAIIGAASEGKRAVIIGASFIGLEVAAALAHGRKVSVTIVAPEKIPFDRILGEEIGMMFEKEHETNGIQFRLGSEIKQIVGENGQVKAVELKSGESLPTDFVVIGVGVHPATDFLADSGLKLDGKDHSVHVSTSLQSSNPDIFAAGDIARWGEGDSSTRIEHWRVAQQHGVIAARNMLGKQDSVENHVPFFWTTQWDIELRYVGHATKWDEIIVRGSPDQKDFIAFYVQDGKLTAAVGVHHDQEMDALEFIMRDNMPLTMAQMRDGAFNLVAYAQQNG